MQNLAVSASRTIVVLTAAKRGVMCIHGPFWHKRARNLA